MARRKKTSDQADSLVSESPKAKKSIFRKSKSIDFSPAPSTADDVPEITVAELDEKFIEMTRQEREEHVKKVVTDAQRIGVEHSKLARLAGHHGLATDLIALAQMGAQIEKKLQTQRYWEKV